MPDIQRRRGTRLVTPCVQWTCRKPWQPLLSQRPRDKEKERKEKEGGGGERETQVEREEVSEESERQAA